MARWKKVLGGFAILVAAAVAYVVWYDIHYSMHPARAFEVNSRTAGEKVLIATQGSEFKDAVVSGVVAHLKSRGAYVRVIDVAALPSVNEADWNAIVVLHTWEMHQPPPDAKRFIDAIRDRHKLIVLSTSGAGTFRIEGVDAISSASEMVDVPQRVAEIDQRLDAMLGSR